MKGLGIVLGFVAVAVLPVIGWVKCLIHLCQCDFSPIGKAEIIYGIGTFTPVGAILGWFDFGI